MINYNKFKLQNGLKVIFHQDTSTPMVCVNILYNVGARDENPDKTGFAHLFEHLMFGGSKNIPDYDEIVEKAGGENNAFTNNDITNYYLTLPKEFLELAFWLESDRMNELGFSEKSLSVQRNVVIEEFKQHYLNQPYGDVSHLLKPLAYKVHPYQWNTIGKEVSHIENASMDDVKAFFYKFYRPNNAILVVAGNATLEDVERLAQKWFEPIPKGEEYVRNLPKEPKQNECRTLHVERDVPANAFYKAYHICNRMDTDYYAFDLISDILSNGKSSRLYNELVKRQQLFTEINAYITGDADEGLFIFTGKLNENISMQQAEETIDKEIEKLKTIPVSELELQKVKNKLETHYVFSLYKPIERAMNLAYYEWLGDSDLINTEPENYQKVSSEQIQRLAQATFVPENSSALYYHKKELSK